MGIADGIKSLTLDSLLERLHDALASFARDVEEVIEENRAVSSEDIQNLRSHIQQRLDKREEVLDNEKLLKLLNLFATDKAVLEIIQEDARGWVTLLEGIEENIKGRGAPTRSEKEEIKEIQRLTGEIKTLIRKG